MKSEPFPGQSGFAVHAKAFSMLSLRFLTKTNDFRQRLENHTVFSVGCVFPGGGFSLRCFVFQHLGKTNVFIRGFRFEFGLRYSGGLFFYIWRSSFVSLLVAVGVVLDCLWVWSGRPGPGTVFVVFLDCRLGAQNGHMDSTQLYKKQMVLGLFMRKGRFAEIVASEPLCSESTCFLEFIVNSGGHLLVQNELVNANFEVSLRTNAQASIDGEVIFLVELLYAGVFAVNAELSKEEIERILLVDCARDVFPFSRRIIADTTREGGFAPLLLDPVDFEMVYKNRKKLAA